MICARHQILVGEPKWDKMSQHVEINGCKIVVGKHHKKRPFWRSGLRWKGTVQTDVKEIGYGSADRIYLDQDSVS
jgi:hypothetical protein